MVRRDRRRWPARSARRRGGTTAVRGRWPGRGRRVQRDAGAPVGDKHRAGPAALSSPASSRGGAGLPHDHVDRVALRRPLAQRLRRSSSSMSRARTWWAWAAVSEHPPQGSLRGPRSRRWRAPGPASEVNPAPARPAGSARGRRLAPRLPAAGALPRRSAEHHKRRNTAAWREPATPAESGQLRPPRHCCIGGSRVRVRQGLMPAASLLSGVAATTTMPTARVPPCERHPAGCGRSRRRRWSGPSRAARCG
jgi:hypothetical protein